MLEDVRGETITRKLIELVDDDPSEAVRNNAVLVLIDRKEPVAREKLMEIATSAAYPISARAAALNDMHNWEPEKALDTLAFILNNETEPRLIVEAADTLSDLGTPEALTILRDAYINLEILESKQIILKELADVRSPDVINFLSDIALNSPIDELAAIANNGIADREDNVAVAALDHIYQTTTNLQRRLAAIHGMGESKTLQAVEVLQQVIQGEADPQLLAAATRALGNTRNEAAVPALLAIYRESSDPAVQRLAINALRRMDRHVAARDALLEILQDRLDAESSNIQ